MSEAIDLSSMHWMPKRETVIQLLMHAWHTCNTVPVWPKKVYKAVSTKVVLQEHIRCTTISSNSLVLIQVHVVSTSKEGKEHKICTQSCVCTVWTFFCILKNLELQSINYAMNQHYPKPPFDINRVHLSCFCRTISPETAFLCPVSNTPTNTDVWTTQ